MLWAIIGWGGTERDQFVWHRLEVLSAVNMEFCWYQAALNASFTFTGIVCKRMVTGFVGEPVCLLLVCILTLAYSCTECSHFLCQRESIQSICWWHCVVVTLKEREPGFIIPRAHQPIKHGALCKVIIIGNHFAMEVLKWTKLQNWSILCCYWPWWSTFDIGYWIFTYSKNPFRF